MHDLPIVVVGGFLSSPLTYSALSAEIRRQSRAPLTTVPLWPPLWLYLGATLRPDMALTLLDEAVRAVRCASGAPAVRLIGHSLGGLLARLYVSQRRGGGAQVAQIVTLGTPHRVFVSNTLLGMRARALIRRLNRECDDQWMATHDLLAVAGQSIFGDRDGPLAARVAHGAYADFTGAGDCWGDGLVPVESARLPGARTLVLPGAGHAPLAGPWYGSPPFFARWWHAAGAATRAESPPPCS